MYRRTIFLFVLRGRRAFFLSRSSTRRLRSGKSLCRAGAVVRTARRAGKSLLCQTIEVCSCFCAIYCDSRVLRSTFATVVVRLFYHVTHLVSKILLFTWCANLVLDLKIKIHRFLLWVVALSTKQTRIERHQDFKLGKGSFVVKSITDSLDVLYGSDFSLVEEWTV